MGRPLSEAGPSRVTDPGDHRVDDHRDLRNRSERASETIVVEGHIAIRRLLASGLHVRSLLLSPRGARLLGAELGRRDIDAFVAEPDVLEAIVGFDLHRGSLAVADRPRPLGPDAVLAASQIVCVLEGVNDHENLGAIARSAAALGIDALLLDPSCADPLYRRSIRVSMGYALSLPTARLEPWPAALAALAGSGWNTVALTPDRDAPPLGELFAERPPQVAIVLGAEGPGLSPGALSAATHQARIPMAAGADSLNVSHAAAIAFHHLGRSARA